MPFLFLSGLIMCRRELKSKKIVLVSPSTTIYNMGGSSDPKKTSNSIGEKQKPPPKNPKNQKDNEKDKKTKNVKSGLGTENT
ncbi:hypothetical protein VNO77_42816 [Canavalia gladiata]|uniref:Uncharacterized protein n=1 Tax=Canavalia gladiata TaxID=3824 RepID=A0AAN9PPE6_CANGL